MEWLSVPLWCERDERSPRRGEIPIGWRKEEKQKQEKNPKRVKNSESVSAGFLKMKICPPWIIYFGFHLPCVFSFC